MARVALSFEQKKAHRLKYIKGWVVAQMKVTGKTQKDVGEALGLAQGTISTMLAIPDGKKKDDSRIKLDSLSVGQMLTLFELFGTDVEERQKLLTL